MSLAIAIDLGGTQIRAALIDAQGTILNRVARPTPAQDGPAAVVAAMLGAAREIMDNQDIVGIGVSSPGPLDTQTGVAVLLPTLKGFENFPFRQALCDAFGCDVKLENDGIAAAIGEWRFGAGRGCADFVYITVSTGIGGGVISGGQVMRGRKGMAGHVGHLMLKPGGLRCGCGGVGCFEAYAAGPAFEARAKSREGRTFEADAASVFAAARSGDPLAMDLVAEEARYLGLGIVSLLHLYSPSRIVMGGGLCHHFDLLKPGIDSQVQALAMPSFRDVDIVKAVNFGNSGLLGAAALVFG